MPATSSGGRGRARRTQSSDAAALRQFTCSTGIWYENEVQRFIRGSLANRVARGFGAWVVEEDGEVVAVAAHEGRPHPGDSSRVITHIMCVAARVDPASTPLAEGARLSQLVRAMATDVRTSGRAPLWYSMVAVDNVRMRRFHEHFGFTGGPVPSKPRYLFYTARTDV